MSWQIASVVPVWVAAIAAAIVVGLVSPADERTTWLAIALAGAVIATFAIQLAIQRKDGFVVRAIASISGAIIVLALATGIFALVG
jgi:hypothetical protein